MIIGSNRKLVNISSFSLLILDTNINTVSSFKYLEIMLSANFTWVDHIDYISCKINKNLSLLRRIRHLLPHQARLLFYNSLVLPMSPQTDLVWGDKDNASLMKDLQILQNKAAKMILKDLFSHQQLKPSQFLSGRTLNAEDFTIAAFTFTNVSMVSLSIL